MNIIKKLVKYQSARRLDEMKFCDLDAHGNIVEEMLESLGFDVPRRNRQILKDALINFVREVYSRGIATNTETPENFKVDAYCDIVVFALGEIQKLGYNPESAMIETWKEISSRTGEIVDGKFEKDLSDEAKARWYKADYESAKMKITPELRTKHYEEVGEMLMDEEIWEWRWGE